MKEMTIEEEQKFAIDLIATWKASEAEALRAEFGSFATFLFFKENERLGRIKICGQGGKS